MGLTPKQSGGCAFKPYDMGQAVLVETLGCSEACSPAGEGGTISVWVKPAGNIGGVITDQSCWHHVHMVGSAPSINVTINGIPHGIVHVGEATTYAEILTEVLTQCAGSAKGYLGELHVLHGQHLGVRHFGKKVHGQWVPKRVGKARNISLDPTFASFDGATSPWELLNGVVITPHGADFSAGETLAAVQQEVAPPLQEKGRTLLVCPTVDAMTQGELRTFVHPCLPSKPGVGSTGPAISSAGTFRHRVSLQEGTTQVGVHASAVPCDAILSRLDILDFDSGPAYAHGSSMLCFGDAQNLGKDSSGNGEDWTLGKAMQTQDRPMRNYCVLNPEKTGEGMQLSTGNLEAKGGRWDTVLATAALPSSGKVYWEVKSSGSHFMFGIATEFIKLKSWVGADSNGYGFEVYKGFTHHNGSATGLSLPGYAYGDVIGLLWDGDAATVQVIHKNKIAGFLGKDVRGVWYPATSCYGSSSMLHNFGATPFFYDLPVGAAPLLHE